MRVVRLVASSGRIYLAEHNEAGVLQKRHDDKDDPFRWAWPTIDQLRAQRARIVRIDALGRISDPGPPRPRAAAAE